MTGVLEEVLGQHQSDVAGVFFFEFDYTAFSTGFKPFRVEAQAAVVDGEEYLWVDGIDFDDPVLLPIRAAQGLRFLGELDNLANQYAQQIGELSITEDLSVVSPTVLVRAARCMVEEKLSSAEALATATALSQMLLELDELDRRHVDTAIQLTMEAVNMYAAA